MNAAVRNALHVAEDSDPDTDHSVLVKASRTLAAEVRRLRIAISGHQGALVAISDDGAEVAQRLDDRWPL